MGIETLSMVLAANEPREVDVSGEYFELRSAAYEVAVVELLDRSGGVKAKLSQPLESDYARPGLFEKVRITNGATPQTVKFVYGTGDAGSRRNSGNVTVQGTVNVSAITGTVAVIDGAKDRTVAGIVGIAAHQLVPVAAQYNRSGIWNPAGSGKRIVLTTLRVGLGVSGEVVFGRIAAALAAQQTPFTQKINGVAYAGLAKQTNETTGTAPGGVIGVVGQVSCPAGDTKTHRLDEPIVIYPGNGFALGALAANVGMHTFLTFYEEPDL